MKTKRQKVTDSYKQFKEEMPWLMFTFLSPKQYQDKNIIYDISPKLSVLNRDNFASIGMYLKQCYNMFDSLLNDARFTNYAKHYFIINIDEAIKVDVRYLMKMNIHTPEQAFFYRLFNEIDTMQAWIGKTIIITNNVGMFTYFEITPEVIEKGLNKIIFRFMKGMWAYSAHDADGMLEAEEDIEKEEDIPKREDPATEQKLTKIASRISENKALSSEPIKNALVNIGENITGATDIDMKADLMDTAMNALSSLSKTINKTASTQVKKTPIAKRKAIPDNVEEVVDDIDKAVSEEPDESDVPEEDKDDYVPDAKTDKTEEEINNIYKEAIEVAKASRLPSKTPAVTRRIKVLKEKAGNIKMDKKVENSKTLNELLKDFEKTTIDVDEVPVVNVPNKSIKFPTGQALARTYYKKQFDADIATMMKQFADAPEINMVVTDITKQDVSDTLNGIIKYTFKFEDDLGKEHKISYNIPKLIDNKFFLIGGNKKMLTGQIASIPVIKTRPDTVRIATAYNQMEITRFGRSFDPKLEILKKLLAKFPGNGYYGLTYRAGDSSEINLKYDTTLEYDSISETYYSIVIESEDKNKSISFIFNQHDIRAAFEDLNIAYIEKPGLMPVAITDNKDIVYIDINTGMDSKEGKFTICDLVISAIRQYTTKDNIEKVINSLSAPKKYMYSRAHYLDRHLSLGVFLGYLFGLKEILQAMGVKYTFEKEKVQEADKYKRNIIKFKDGFLYYDVYPVRNSLLLNGIAAEMDCENFTFDEMESENPYLQTFDKLFSTRHMGKGFKDCKAWLIDFKSAQVMRALNLPDTFLPIMLYANSLLEDDSVVDPKSTDVNRIRNLELIPCVFMYKSLTQSYIQYKYRYTKTGTMHVSENDILDKMNASGLFRDYDTLNPIREIETEGSLTFKGPGGCKVTDAYTLSRRAFDKSMVGVFAASSPDSGDVGITKYMSLNPRITSTLGFVKSGESDNPEEIDYGNIGSVAELLAPLAIDHDDAKRLGMVGKESKHLMAATETDPLLIGNGVEKVVPYMTSNDFITVAKKPGKVLKVDKDLGIAIVEYSDGEKESIDIVDRQHKDGGMGFYVVSRKNFDFKEGDSFKKNDILARNPSYFSTESGHSKPEFNPGVLSNVAIVMSPYTFEDSTIITERIAGRMSTEVVMLKQVVLGAKSQIHSIAKIGDNVAAGEALMVYEDEIDDPEINAMINSSDAKNLTALEDLVKQTPHSKVTGIIHDVKVYYTVPTTEMSESVKAVVDSYNKKIKARKKVMEEYGAAMPNEIITDYVGITKPSSGDKIRGIKCPTGKILVEIYTKYTDRPNSGDKVVFFAAMKCVVARTLPQELAPYPVGKKDEPIDALLSPISVEARMVTSILHMLFGNKCVAGLKEKVRNVYNKYAKIEQKGSKPTATTEDFNVVNTLKNLGYSANEIVEALKD
jgi:hypothetical protein